MKLVSPASTPDKDGVFRCAQIFESWGLRVELGAHVFREVGYLAGTDEERAADVNDALRDPGVRAIFASRGGKGAYRILDRLDFTAARADPKVLIGFSDITNLHLVLWKECRLVGIHGPLASWSSEYVGLASVEALRRAIMTADPVTLRSQPTSVLTTHGRAAGTLLGGNLDAIANAAGWALPSFVGAILLIEGFGVGLGHIDRQLTMLANAGHLRGVQGIAVGQFTRCGTHGDWTAVDVLRDRLARLGVPILGGLSIGHGLNPATVPLGTAAVLDADAGTLEIASGVRAA
ncbi:MAG TPA: LD-carboxypeptidase [Hyphomicrobiaceae bacterium]|nr:LD-carboxypeptidase [Hyphomicrobiaceae bacterium]